MIFYTSYPYAPKASLFSGLANTGAFVSICAGIVLILQFAKNTILVLPGILLIALAAFLFLYVSRKLVPKYAEKETEINITTKPAFTKMYVQAHPDQYERMCEINPAFAEKFVKDENGKIVKRK